MTRPITFLHPGRAPRDWERIEVVDLFTRAESLRSGALVDVTQAALVAGFKGAGLPGASVAMGRRLWDLIRVDCDLVATTRRLELVMVHVFSAVTRANHAPDRIYCTLIFGAGPSAPRPRIVIHIGPGEREQSVLTICHEEDLAHVV